MSFRNTFMLLAPLLALGRIVVPGQVCVDVGSLVVNRVLKAVSRNDLELKFNDNYPRH